MKRFGKLPFLCNNDTCDDAASDDRQLQRIGQTLETLLPRPSSFELPATPKPIAGSVIEKTAGAGSMFLS